MSQIELEDAELIRGQYQVVEKLGQSVAGRTLLARDVVHARQVVLKVLFLEQAEGWKELELFERGAKTLRNLSHRQIPGYYDAFYSEEQARFYLVQEHVEGTDLATLLGQGKRWDESAARDFLGQMLDVLGYLHGLSPPVIHRDLKPSNIMLCADGRYVLIDFDVVQTIVPGDVGGSTVVGTSGYVAPEQLMGRAVVGSDLYGLGTTAVHLATGVHPVQLAIRRGRLEFRSLSTLSNSLNDVLERLVEPNFDERFQSVDEVGGALSGAVLSANVLIRHALKERSEDIIRSNESLEVLVGKRGRGYQGHRVEIECEGQELVVTVLSCPRGMVASSFWMSGVMFGSIYIMMLVGLVLSGLEDLKTASGLQGLFIVSLVFVALGWGFRTVFHYGKEKEANESGIEQQLMLSSDHITLTESKKHKWWGGDRRDLNQWTFPLDDLREVYVLVNPPIDGAEIEDILGVIGEGSDEMKAGILLVDRFGTHRYVGEDVLNLRLVDSVGYKKSYDELLCVAKVMQLYVEERNGDVCFKEVLR